MLYVVRNVHGSAWDPGRGLREQVLWTEHAAFMDGLVDDGFVVLGGPVRGGALLIVEAASEDAVRDRLEQDPWTPSGHLRVGSIESWEILLGELPRHATQAEDEVTNKPAGR